MDPDRFIGKEIELAGDNLTFPEAISVLSKAKGEKISFNPISYDQIEKMAGKDFALMFKWFDEVGYIADIPNLSKTYGIPLTTFSDVVKTANWAKPAKVST